MTTLREKMDNLPAALRKEVETLTKELIAEEMSRRKPRKVREQAQVHVTDKRESSHENGSLPRATQGSADLKV